MPPNIPIWRLTRSAFARQLYEACVDAGVRIAVLDRFSRELGDPVKLTKSPAGDLEIRLALLGPGTTGVDPAGDPESALLTMVDTDDEKSVGQLRLTTASRVFIPELQGTLEIEGGYIWDVRVDSAFRRRGIGSRLLTTALRWLRSVGARRASALVAPDNNPSRAMFRSKGFIPNQRYRYLSLFGLERATQRELRCS
jgi:ribosomal protein S18 acetylase RimI-like enzyme